MSVVYTIFKKNTQIQNWKQASPYLSNPVRVGHKIYSLFSQHCQTLPSVTYHYHKAMENLIRIMRHTVRIYILFSKGGNICGENTM